MRITPTPIIDEKEYTTVYDKFKGVDFSQDASLVDKSRSPDAPNLVSGEGFIPEKRKGWRELYLFTGAAINGIFEYGTEKIIHAGTKIYKYIESTDTATELYSGCANAISTAFNMNSKLYIMTGTEYLVYNGTTLVAVEGYIPTILISRPPAGGGVVYEGINLISDKRIESFLGDASATTYQLSATNITSVDKVEVMVAGGGWTTYTKVDATPGATEYTVNLTTGRVTFNAAKSPIVAGMDNVKVTYTKPVTGYADRIKKCTLWSLFGLGGENRVFVSGNPDYKAQDWYSGLYDPTYFSDLNYTIIGSEEKAIMNYKNFSSYQEIVKETSQSQGTIYKRLAGLNSDGDVVFTIETGVSGLGSISKRASANLVDEPLFLTTQGIYAITTYNVLSHNTIRNRSFFIDNRLTREPNLENAIACEYNGYFMLFINSHVYLLDSRQVSNVGRSDIDYVYESYYWDNVPASAVLSSKTGLYFGTSTGSFCKFNYDIDTMSAFNDDDDAIDAYWTTKNDDDDVPYLLKTTEKGGNFITIKPNTRSSASIYIKADSGEDTFLKSGTMDRFSFADMDFERFTFETSDAPKEIYFRKKIKKYKRLQFIVRNNVKDEAFGIFQIVKTYTRGNFAKK